MILNSSRTQWSHDRESDDSEDEETSPTEEYWAIPDDGWMICCFSVQFIMLCPPECGRWSSRPVSFSYQTNGKKWKCPYAKGTADRSEPESYISMM